MEKPDKHNKSKGKRTKKSKVVSAQIVAAFVELRLNGLVLREIIRYIKVDKELSKLDIKDDVAEYYIRLADKVICEPIKEATEHSRAKAHARYEWLYKKMALQKDYKGASDTNSKICNLLGSNAAIKTQNEVVLKETDKIDLSLLTDKELETYYELAKKTTTKKTTS